MSKKPVIAQKKEKRPAGTWVPRKPCMKCGGVDIRLTHTVIQNTDGTKDWSAEFLMCECVRCRFYWKEAVLNGGPHPDPVEIR